MQTACAMAWLGRSGNFLRSSDTTCVNDSQPTLTALTYDLPRGALVALLVIVEAWNAGTPVKFTPTLARLMRRGQRTAENSVKQLKERGLIEWQRDEDGDIIGFVPAPQFSAPRYPMGMAA